LKSVSISKRKFVLCRLQGEEVPIENGIGCCEFYNDATNRCDYSKYVHSSHKRLSERDEIYREFSQYDEEE